MKNVNLPVNNEVKVVYTWIRPLLLRPALSEGGVHGPDEGWVDLVRTRRAVAPHQRPNPHTVPASNASTLRDKGSRVSPRHVYRCRGNTHHAELPSVGVPLPLVNGLEAGDQELLVFSFLKKDEQKT